MCHFITMVVPPNSDLDEVKSILHRHKFGFESIDNPHLANVLKPGETYFLPAKNHCDCGTLIGSFASPDRELAQPDLEKQITKLRRKRWGQAKIDKWLAQKAKHVEKKVKAQEDFVRSMDDPDFDPEGRVTLIRDLLGAGGLPYVGILLHHYSGLLNEKMTVTRGALDASDHLGRALCHISEDMLYIVS